MSSSKRFSKAPSAKRLIKKPLRPAETTMVKASNSISARFKEEIFRANSPLPTSSNNQNPYGFLDNEEYKEELVSVEVEMEQYDDVNASTAGPFHSSNLTSMNSSNLSSFNGSYLSSINGSAPHSLNGSFLSSIHAGSNQNSFDENRRLSHAGDLDSVDNGLSFDELGDDDDVSELKFDKNRRLRMSSPATLHEHLEHALNDHRASNEILGLEDEFEERMQIANDSTVMAHGENDENADISGNGGAPGKSHDAMDDDMM